MAALHFHKVEGLANDFLLLDCRDRDHAALEAETARLRGLASQLCDRRRGVGADGLLLVGPSAPSSSARASMVVLNFDGSRPEMCGNGLRCVAAHVATDMAQLDGERFVIDTDAGPRPCEVARSPASVQVRVEMGPAVRLGTQQPVAGAGRSFVGVSMGNPHAICFVGPDEDPEALARELGPALELDPAYAPAKTNVEFARVEGDGSVLVWVWERGVGITSACGTGACATAVAAVDGGLAPPDTALRVRLPGGELEVVVPRQRDAQVSMRGLARQVFSGVMELPDSSSSQSSSSPSSSSPSSSSPSSS